MAADTEINDSTQKPPPLRVLPIKDSKKDNKKDSARKDSKSVNPSQPSSSSTRPHTRSTSQSEKRTFLKPNPTFKLPGAPSKAPTTKPGQPAASLQPKIPTRRATAPGPLNFKPTSILKGPKGAAPSNRSMRMNADNFQLPGPSSRSEPPPRSPGRPKGSTHPKESDGEESYRPPAAVGSVDPDVSCIAKRLRKRTTSAAQPSKD
ncbi:translation initiation factor IF-2-like [Leptopilina heterotoma]|uniref:translation initiation factor IF-2-like n=1 Tax=Leptopilina heterotoma TaxID=63436 RepID=UPI001CAA0DEA|nr:translation initiation factor IF-2-like [Leptopilina heterotoma]